LADDDRSSGTSNNGNVRRLVIVESPTKARKIAGYLGRNYVVESSRGHIRDLPKGAADVPAKYKTEKWARLGVKVDEDFEPLYVISPDKKSTVTELKSLLKGVDELYLATDGDREGEAIAWHLLQTLKPSVPVRRMVFHEITEPAIRAAAENPRDLDIDLVDAQETRRILDRLYGYEVSPVLWKKVAPRLSAGRVQSVATRIIVQRERERMAFRSASYWDVLAELDASVSDATATPPRFNARLVAVDGKRVATGRDFDSLGTVRKPDEVTVLNEAAAGAGRRADRRFGGGEALHPASLPAVHDLDSAAGGGPQTAVQLGAHDECGPAPLRERLHHLHAYRLHDAVGVGDQRRAQSGSPALRRRLRASVAPAVHPQGEECPGGARSHPACR
jgi:DNA topoisomerase-1